MGGYSSNHCNFTPKRPFMEFDNEFSRVLSKKGQSMGGYRVKLLNSGFMSKARKENDKVILKLKATEVKK